MFSIQSKTEERDNTEEHKHGSSWAGRPGRYAGLKWVLLSDLQREGVAGRHHVKGGSCTDVAHSPSQIKY